MISRRIPLFILVLLVFSGLLWSVQSCIQSGDSESQSQPINETPLTYLALGDSYTIGESVDPEERWPVELVRQLDEKGLKVEEPKIIARTGWRTDNMLDAAKNEIKEDEKFDMVSLLIGVNDEFQGKSKDQFIPQFRTCLKYAIDHCKTGELGVFVVSIPDYGYTPYGKPNQKKISKRLDAYNKVCADNCDSYDVPFYNITPISRSNPDDETLVAKDGLHPSGHQYKLWVDSFSESVFQQFKP